jgi:pantothenate kinase
MVSHTPPTVVTAPTALTYHRPVPVDPPLADEGGRRATIGVAELVAQISAESADRPRYLLGLAGPPGCGKSTFATRVERLVARHVDHGRSPDDARSFVMRSDEANASLVAASRHRADVVVDPSRP